MYVTCFYEENLKEKLKEKLKKKLEGEAKESALGYRRFIESKEEMDNLVINEFVVSVYGETERVMIELGANARRKEIQEGGKQ